MRLSVETPATLSEAMQLQASELAALGFRRNDTTEITADTKAHLAAADYIQFAYENHELAAFTAYTRRLWRANT